MRAWWNGWVDAHGSTRSSAWIRVGLVAVVWARFAGEVVPWRHPDDPLRWLLAVGFFVTTTATFVGLFTPVATAGMAAVLWWMYAQWGFFGGELGWVHHHTWLLVAASTWLATLPCGRSSSLDQWRSGGAMAEVGPLWGLTLLRAQVVAVYLFSALDKTNGWFLSGGHLLAIVQDTYTGSDPLGGPVLALACQFIALSTVLLEAALPFGLLSRWRRTAMVVGLAFHGLLYVLLPVSTFSATMAVLYLAFLEPDGAYEPMSSMTTSAKSTIKVS